MRLPACLPNCICVCLCVKDNNYLMRGRHFDVLRTVGALRVACPAQTMILSQTTNQTWVCCATWVRCV